MSQAIVGAWIQLDGPARIEQHSQPMGLGLEQRAKSAVLDPSAVTVERAHIATGVVVAQKEDPVPGREARTR